MSLLRRRAAWLLLGCLGASACTSADSGTGTTPTGGTGGSGASPAGTGGASGGGTGGSGGAGNSSGGSSGTGGSAGTGGTTGTGGTNGSGGASESGGASGSGGASASSGGASGSGGASAGSGGGGSAGTGGSGGNGGAGAGGLPEAGGAGATREAGPGTSEDKAAAAVLDRYAILKPCTAGFKLTPNPNGDCCCQETADEENQHKTLHFGGDASVTYNVTLHVRGVAERYWYEGGMLDGPLFYRGGLPTIHSAATATKNGNLKPGQGACKVHPPETDKDYALPFKVPAEINPTDGCFNGFNIFALVVSAPKKSYYLNYTTDYDNVDRQPHKVYKNDYVVTIPIQGGATLDFYTIDGDHHQVTNDGTMSIDGVKLAQPYNGNFLEFEVVNVTRAQ